MKLSIKNIGKISESTIELNGITVIAGENDTGKSTFGKILFSFFNSFYKINEQIKKEKFIFIQEDVFGKSIKKNMEYYANINNLKKLTSDIIDNQEDYKKNEDMLYSKINNFIEGLKEQNIDSRNIISEIKTIINISNDDLFKKILQKHLNSEFNNQINNLFFQEQQAEINLEIKKNIMKVFINNNKVSSFNNIKDVNLKTEVIYIDDPYILDKISMENFVIAMLHQGINENDHQAHLLRKLNKTINDLSMLPYKKDKDYEQSENIISNLLKEKEMERIFEKINDACPGKLVESKNGIEYQTRDSIAFDIRNISTGLKSFVILKTLLSNGSLERNGTIVLDEPEVHIHPKWQVLLAEIIVIIQKELNLHILINTHSPYFLWGLETYSKKYQIDKKCKYYLSDYNGRSCFVEDVTDKTDKIFDKLGEPFQKLENTDFEF